MKRKGEYILKKKYKKKREIRRMDKRKNSAIRWWRQSQKRDKGKNMIEKKKDEKEKAGKWKP